MQEPFTVQWPVWQQEPASRITGEKKGTDGKTWYRIQYTGSNGQAGTGYVSAAYIRLPVSYSTDASFESPSDFPGISGKL